MVKKVDRRGLYDWVIQRVSAVLIGVYALFLMTYFLLHEPLHYSIWHDLFAKTPMKIITIVVLISILWHAWIGLWTVLTDYVKNRMVRLLLEAIIIAALLVYLFWCFDILWGK